jgi:hypothetical protein
MVIKGRDNATDDLLAAKIPAVKPVSAEQVPVLVFGIRHIPAQFFSALKRFTGNVLFDSKALRRHMYSYFHSTISPFSGGES